jgi:hypothetical protein
VPAGFPVARRWPGGFGEGLADHAAVNVVAAGDLPDDMPRAASSRMMPKSRALRAAWDSAGDGGGS